MDPGDARGGAGGEAVSYPPKNPLRTEHGEVVEVGRSCVGRPGAPLIELVSESAPTIGGKHKQWWLARRSDGARLLFERRVDARAWIDAFEDSVLARKAKP